MAGLHPPENLDDSSSSSYTRHLSVGDESCTFLEVRDVLYGCASSAKLWPKVLDIARSLQIPTECIISLKKQINTETITYSCALFEILEAWRGKFSADAKLQNLINVLERNDLADCADSLRIHFNQFDDAYVTSRLQRLKSTAKSNIWEDLPDHLKRWINNQPVLFQGQKNKLKELTAQVVSPVDEKILDELAARTIPCIINDNVPEPLEYYVHRTVTSRNILKMDVLKETCKDVFVIEGMEQHQISLLVEESTDVSGNQLVYLTVRFILLQHKPDFDQICKIALNTPVHWIKYKNETLELVTSSGSVKTLQNHIHDSQDSFNENELASKIQKVVVIADSPGMGKTCLLANIAHQIMREQPTMLVRFLVLKELVDALAKKKINMESIVKEIAEQSSQYEFGKKFVENSLTNRECVLLFDGLDEVLSSQTTIAKEILQEVAMLPSAKVFVATRPHLRNEMENTLHVFAYTMEPFNESNQINFLTEFWKKKGATPNESLRKFTQKCVTQLSSKMRDNERNIAGIPLQCRMLAETYEAQAIRCSNVGYHSDVSADSVVIVDSIFGIYDRYMNLRFEKILEQESGGNEYEIIKNVHMYFALELLFPNIAKKFKALNNLSIELHELCGLGILEATHSNSIRFVHRTFAEYLVAWLALENIINSSTNRDLLLSTIFKVTPKEVKLFNALGQLVNLESFEFDFLVICYFVNGLAKKYAPRVPAIDHNEQMLPFYIASARDNYEYIPNIVTHSAAQLNPIKISESYMRNLFYIAARYSDLELMKILCTIFDITKINFMKIEKSFPYETFTLTPLHVAIERGHYRLVEYLLKKFENIASQVPYLIHLCVRLSFSDSNSIVDNKIQIVKLLSNVNKVWIYEDGGNQTIPLMQASVHPRLFKCLLQQDDNLNTIDEDGNTLLHKIVEKTALNGKSYHQIVNAFSQQGFKLFNKPNKQQATPLHFAVARIELLRYTVEFFLSKGADLNAVDEKGDSVLFYAIQYNRSIELMSMLINLGADTKHRNYMGKNALHISVEKNNLNALKYLIETHNLNVDDEDSNGNTPLHLVAEWESWKRPELIMMLLIELGSNVNAENKLDYTPFMLAFESGKGLSLTLIKEMEKHGLNITKSVASRALTASFLRLEIDSVTHVPLDTLEYLMEKGGQVNFEFIDNLWKWGVVQEGMQRIIECTQITSELLAKSKKHGILSEHDCMELETLHKSVESKRFYEMVENKSGSFERVYVIMQHSKVSPFALEELRMWLEAARKKTHQQIFVTRNRRVKELMDSNVNVMAVVTNDVELSIKRIRDTFDENVQVVEEHELNKVSTEKQNNFVVLKCNTLATELLKKVVCLNLKCLCVCKETHDGVEGCEIVREIHDWADISSKFIKKLWFRVDSNLHNFTQLFATPNVIRQMWQLEMSDTRNLSTILEIVDYKIVHEQSTYLSNEVFIENTNCTFPFCDCPTSCKLFITFRVYYKTYFNEVVKCELEDVLPNGQKVFGIQEEIDLFALRELLNHLNVPKPCRSYFNQKLLILKEKESACKGYGKTTVEIICKLVEHLGNGEHHENLQQVAVNTLFQQLTKIVPSSSRDVEKYIHLGLLEYRKKYLVFKHDVLATYFIAEMIVDQVDSYFVNECFNEIFLNCFNEHNTPISFFRDYAEFRTKSIPSYKFRETRLFKYLDFFATKDKYKDAISTLLSNLLSPLSLHKCIHSIVNDNLVNLFEVFMKLGFDYSNAFESEDLVVLAVAHGDVPLVELVTHEYKKHNNNQLNNIKLPLIYYHEWVQTFKFQCFISVLDVAALNLHYSLFRYLNRIIDQPEMEHLVYLCVAYSNAHEQLDDRKRILKFLFENYPSLFQNPKSSYHLLAPKIHVDIIIHLINLGVNLHVTNERKKNLLHLCAEYFLTSFEYDRVVKALVERQQTELLRSRDEDQNTPLHCAVKHYELLDSTFQLLLSANVEFNAVNKYNTTVLHSAMMFGRSSARNLDLLINAGADEKVRDQYGRTVLHYAAVSGNLTALKYFILRGHDVNVTDLNGSTPLHLAVSLSKINTHEMVVLLVEYGTNVNAIDMQQKTPLDMIIGEKTLVGTKEFLIKHGAKCYESVREILEEAYRKWEWEMINKNIEKLTSLTKFDSEWVQTFKSVVTSLNLEELMENDSLDAKDFYRFVMSKEYDLKIILNLLHNTQNTEAANLLTKEVITSLYEALMSRKYSFAHFAMEIKGIYDVLQPFLNAMELIDRHQYTDKFKVLELIFMLDPEFFKSKSAEMLSPIQLALLCNHEKQFEMIELLISHKVDLNERDSNSLSPLHYAVAQEHVPPHVIEIVKLLIENGADPDAVDQHGLTFLHQAPYFLTPEIYDELIVFFDSSGRKDSIKLLTHQNHSHLHQSVVNFVPLPSSLDIFKSNGIDFNGQDNDGDSVVFLAIEGGRNAEFLSTLFEYGSDLKIPNKNQENALHVSALYGNVSALELFISFGCDVNAKNIEGRTPLHNAFLAKKNAQDIMTEHEIVVMLLKESVDVCAKDTNGKTPIDLARERLVSGKVKQKTVELLEKYSGKVPEAITSI
ncbi:unnamed protein product [Orchesella dallaii]|uniref:NACHT domain-containing protein n=1 Tax=Orchesella dallaii TaxID=48710 RepID=A0ABP1R3I1_9HEXA